MVGLHDGRRDGTIEGLNEGELEGVNVGILVGSTVGYSHIIAPAEEDWPTGQGTQI